MAEQGPHEAFAPIAAPTARVLILGSLPGAESLRRGQYYAHPQNAFWRLMGAVLDCELAALGYAERVARLQDAGVALWDVIARARRTGSLDAAIRDAEGADLTRLVAALPELRAVAFNGRKASEIGRRLLAGADGRFVLIDLPSSSPAHARPFAEKLEAWSVLGRYLR